jgi:hypothetical protein
MSPTQKVKLCKASALWPTYGPQRIYLFKWATGRLELRPVDQRDVEMALTQDRVCAKK